MKAIDLHYATNVSAQFVFDGDEWDIETYTVQRRVSVHMSADVCGWDIVIHYTEVGESSFEI